MSQIILSHPTGNANVRQVLQALDDEIRLHRFVTSLGWSQTTLESLPLPRKLQRVLGRRSYRTLTSKIKCYPCRELLRQLGVTINGFSDISSVYQYLDQHVAASLTEAMQVQAVYCYEDGALATFRRARELGIRCIYDLPIAYWKTSRRILEEEAERLPDWKHTLGSIDDSMQKCARKDEELTLADCVICPSQFVADSIPQEISACKPVHITPFGSPLIDATKPCQPNRRLKVLFAGSMSQRKGLADLMSAMRLLDSSVFELHVMGSLIAPMDFYQKQCPCFFYHNTRPHTAVLELMRTCDIFVLPSLVEGRALVQQEALACGLPIIVTANAGAEDLVSDGKAGFLVPIRSPKAIAEKLQCLADDRDLLAAMSKAAIDKAATITWESYRRQISEITRCA